MIQLWIEFSENLTVPVNKEIPSLHWSREQKTIHSGISKFRGEKQYHPYNSVDLKHDQVFVDNVIENVLNEVEVSSDIALPGSSKFRVMVFSPDSDVVKTAPHLCICDRCLEDYGNCDQPQPSCDDDGDSSDDDDDANDIIDVDYFVIDKICAVAADKGSIGPIFFVNS